MLSRYRALLLPLLAVASLCSASPLPVSPPVPSPVDVFYPGLQSGVLQYRIPALVRTAAGTLLAFAEARTDPAVDCAFKWLVARRSTDEGLSWSASINVAGNNNKTLASGNPQVVYHAPSGRVVLTFGARVLPPGKFVYCSPGDGVFVVHDGGSDGLKWSAPANISAQLGGMDTWGGLLPGPGAGVVTTSASPQPNRIVFSGSVGAYGRDVAFYSDDAGESWAASATALPGMDESCPAQLPNGTLYLSMRNDHATPCDCQAFSTSDDAGVTWSSIQYDPVLVSPVCEGAVAVADNGRMYFANPADTSSRSNLTVRATAPNSLVWQADTWLLSPGLLFGGYNSLSVSAPVAVLNGTQCGAALFERTHIVPVISFTLFPLEF